MKTRLDIFPALRRSPELSLLTALVFATQFLLTLTSYVSAVGMAALQPPEGFAIICTADGFTLVPLGESDGPVEHQGQQCPMGSCCLTRGGDVAVIAPSTAMPAPAMAPIARNDRRDPSVFPRRRPFLRSASPRGPPHEVANRGPFPETA